MTRTTIRAFSIILGLALFLVVPGLSQIFGPVAPQKSSTVACEQCPTGPTGPYRQCWVYCRSRDLCTDQCYADASTCELVTCICLLC